MGRLRAKLQHKYKERNEDINIHMPRNLETLKLNFRGERVAKVNLEFSKVLISHSRL
jgi:cleavage and polyadenylation specificity factor subunit 3